jgi:hypothetical protein
MKMKAAKTPDEIKKKIKEKATKLYDDPFFSEKFESLGRSFALSEIEKNN